MIFIKKLYSAFFFFKKPYHTYIIGKYGIYFGGSIMEGLGLQYPQILINAPRGLKCPSKIEGASQKI
jgi:hypothetical protein